MAYLESHIDFQSRDSYFIQRRIGGEFDNLAALQGVCHSTPADREAACATELEVSNMRKLLRGACISPLDRNDGKLHVCCPCLYKLAMDKVFDVEDLQIKF